jgi:anti-anti-sigma regulatory factor
MLKITKMEDNGTTVVLKLEGKVTEQWASLLESECLAFLRNHHTLFLDCADVNFLDARGVDVLRTLRLNKVTIIDAPGIVTELLRTGGQ